MFTEGIFPRQAFVRASQLSLFNEFHGEIFMPSVTHQLNTARDSWNLHKHYFQIKLKSLLQLLYFFTYVLTYWKTLTLMIICTFWYLVSNYKHLFFFPPSLESRLCFGIHKGVCRLLHFPLAFTASLQVWHTAYLLFQIISESVK